MATFTVISVGRLKERYFEEAAAEYIKRIGGYTKLNLIDVKSDTDIIGKIPGGAFVFALCVEGRQLTSEAFSQKLESVYHSEKKSVCFLIGGSDGLPDDVKAAADFRLSMSEMTFPHRLAKIMLLEQLYRALSIQNNGKYHK